VQADNAGPKNGLLRTAFDPTAVREILDFSTPHFSEAPFDVVAWNNFQVWMRWVERIPEW
jgi:hypothetical protein